MNVDQDWVEHREEGAIILRRILYGTGRDQGDVVAEASAAGTSKQPAWRWRVHVVGAGWLDRGDVRTRKSEALNRAVIYGSHVRDDWEREMRKGSAGPIQQ
jgi:hypothetical protein